MKDFGGKLAVITGGGTGMGRELAAQLSAEGCDIAMCDVSSEEMATTRQRCVAEGAQGVHVSTHLCDVTREDQVVAFRDEALREHDKSHINLLFNNAGIGSAPSFVSGPREEWDRVFEVCWFGVYYCARAFMPLLVAADEGHMINTSSVNGFWATLGPHTTHSAYASAKFAVKGFSEALINDLRLHAPHVKVSVVMPGHVGTRMGYNGPQILYGRDIDALTEKDISDLRARMARGGVDTGGMDDAAVAAAAKAGAQAFEQQAPTTAGEAATIILDGVREERWRILVGEDAGVLDEMVRGAPEEAYGQAFMDDFVSRVPWVLGT